MSRNTSMILADCTSLMTKLMTGIRYEVQVRCVSTAVELQHKLLLHLAAFRIHVHHPWIAGLLFSLTPAG
jgi:hypothetical protein